MEEVRTIEGVRLPVLTPNLKVNYVHSIGLVTIFMVLLYNIYCTFASSVLLRSPFIRDLRQLLQQEQKKLQYLHLLLKDFPSQT